MGYMLAGWPSVGQTRLCRHLQPSGAFIFPPHSVYPGSGAGFAVLGFTPWIAFLRQRFEASDVSLGVIPGEGEIGNGRRLVLGHR